MRASSSMSNQRTLRIDARIAATVSVVAAALAITAVTPSQATAGRKNFMAVLNSGQETPPNGAPATGNALLWLDTSTDVLCFSISYEPLLGAETATHIHGPGSPGIPAPIHLDISPVTATVPGSVAIGSGKGSCIDLNLVTTLGFNQKNFLKDLKKGQTYINVHSAVHLGGEIRGQIIPVKGK